MQPVTNTAHDMGQRQISVRTKEKGIYFKNVVPRSYKCAFIMLVSNGL